MKNKHIERLREKARRYKKVARNDSRWDHKLSIKIYHVYDGTRKLAFWDDVSFIEGGQQVTVFYTHLRSKYSDECDSLAQEASKHLRDDSEDLFAGSTPNYKYLGKNKKRKRVVSWTLKELKRSDYFVEWQRLQHEYLKTSDIVVKPSFSVEQFSYCRGVSICIPMEVVDITTLKELADFVRACLRDHTLFDKTYGDATYSKDDWNRDFPDT